MDIHLSKNTMLIPILNYLNLRRDERLIKLDIVNHFNGASITDIYSAIDELEKNGLIRGIDSGRVCGRYEYKITILGIQFASMGKH